MSTEWKALIEKRRSELAVKNARGILHEHGNVSYDSLADLENGPTKILHFNNGHASLEPLLLKAIEALEQMKDVVFVSMDDLSQIRPAFKAIAEIKKELEQS
jgi:hypothetical protein